MSWQITLNLFRVDIPDLQNYKCSLLEQRNSYVTPALDTHTGHNWSLVAIKLRFQHSRVHVPMPMQWCSHFL